ncbi:MAG: DNA alkylation repair protein, partial [Cyanobacteria bacterium J06639_14]
MVNSYLDAIQQLYRQHANPEQAIPMKQYMRGQFEFLGIKRPQAQALFKQLKTEQKLP